MFLSKKTNSFVILLDDKYGFTYSLLAPEVAYVTRMSIEYRKLGWTYEGVGPYNY